MRPGKEGDTMQMEERGTFTTNTGSFQFLRDDGLVFTGSISGNTLTVVIPRPQPAISRQDIMVYTK